MVIKTRKSEDISQLNDDIESVDSSLDVGKKKYKLFMVSDKRFLQSEQSQLFLFNSKKYIITEDNYFYQVKLSQDKNQSTIFVGQKILEDKNIYLVSKIDPMFIMLIVFDINLNEQLKIKDQIIRHNKLKDLIDSKNDHEQLFLDKLFLNENLLKSLEKTCNICQIDSEFYYKLDNQKLNEWISDKYNVLKESIKKNLKNITNEIVNQDANLTGFIFYLLKKYQSFYNFEMFNQFKIDADFFAFQFLNECIPKQFFEKFLNKLGVEPVQVFEFRQKNLLKQQNDQQEHILPIPKQKQQQTKKINTPEVKNNTKITSFFKKKE